MSYDDHHHRDEDWIREVDRLRIVNLVSASVGTIATAEGQPSSD